MYNKFFLEENELEKEETENNIDQAQLSECILVRPKFSHFRGISELIYQNVLNGNCLPTVSYIHPYSRANKSLLMNESIPIGFQFKNPIVFEDLSSLRFRGDEQMKLSKIIEKNDKNDQKTRFQCKISAVYFPLLSVLIPKWIKNIVNDDNTVKKVVLLISGKGTPK
jgi:hypothetical protein